jgi:hypothetical protein
MKKTIAFLLIILFPMSVFSQTCKFELLDSLSLEEVLKDEITDEIYDVSVVMDGLLPSY